MNRFKPGDLVTCIFSEEIIQPMRIVGPNLWYGSNSGVYYVVGKHRRNGNEVTITLTESVLKEYVDP
jgi:hypothetical protein